MTAPEWEQPERCPYAHRERDLAEDGSVKRTGRRVTAELDLEIWLCSEGHEFFVESLS